MSWLRNVKQWTEVRQAGELFRLAEDREAFSTKAHEEKGEDTN